MDLASLLQPITTDNELCIFIEGVIESEGLPSWNNDTSALELWINKAKKYENVQVVNAVTQLCIRYTKFVENEEERDSLILLYLQLNSIVEAVNSWPAPYDWVPLSFWESISEFQMTIIRTFPHKLHCYLLDLGKILLKSTMKTSLPVFLRQLRIKSLNSMLEDSPKHIRVAFKEDIKEKLPVLLSLLQEVGDYDYQTSILETIFRLTLPQERADNVDGWFPDLDNDIKQFFTGIDDFDPDCRKFLNAYNQSLGSQRQVHTFRGLYAAIGEYELRKPRVSSYEYLWTDFNLGTKTVSLLFDHADPNVPTQERMWETIMVYANEIDEAALVLSPPLAMLTLRLNKNPSTFFASPPEPCVASQLTSEFTLKFPFDIEFESLCSAMFPFRLKVYHCTNESSGRSSVTTNKLVIGFDEEPTMVKTGKQKESETVCELLHHHATELVNSDCDYIPGTCEENKSELFMIRKQEDKSSKEDDKRANDGIIIEKESIQGPASTSKITRPRENIRKTAKSTPTQGIKSSTIGTVPSDKQDQLSKSRVIETTNKTGHVSETIESIVETFDNQRLENQVHENKNNSYESNCNINIVYEKITIDDIFGKSQSNSDSERQSEVPGEGPNNEKFAKVELTRADLPVGENITNMSDEDIDKTRDPSDSGLIEGSSMWVNCLHAEKAYCVQNETVPLPSEKITEDIPVAAATINKVLPDSDKTPKAIPASSKPVNEAQMCTPLLTTLQILSKYPSVVKVPKTPPNKYVVQRQVKSTSSKPAKVKQSFQNSPKSESRKHSGRVRRSLFNPTSCDLLDGQPPLEEEVEVTSLDVLNNNNIADSGENVNLPSGKPQKGNPVIQETSTPVKRMKKSLKKRKKVIRRRKNAIDCCFSSDSSADTRQYKKPKFIKQPKVNRNNKCSTPKAVANGRNFSEDEKQLKLSKVDIYSDFSNEDGDDLSWLDKQRTMNSKDSNRSTSRITRTYSRRKFNSSGEIQCFERKIRKTDELPENHINISPFTSNATSRRITRSFAKKEKMQKNVCPSNFRESIANSVYSSSPEVLRNKSHSNLNSVDDCLSLDRNFSLVPTVGIKIAAAKNKFSDISNISDHSSSDCHMDQLGERAHQCRNIGVRSDNQSSEFAESVNGNALYVDPRVPESLKESAECITERSLIQRQIDGKQPQPRITYVQDTNSSYGGQLLPNVCETTTESPCLNDNLPAPNFDKSADQSQPISVSPMHHDSEEDCTKATDSGYQQRNNEETLGYTDMSKYKSLSKEYSSFLPLSQTEDSVKVSAEIQSFTDGIYSTLQSKLKNIPAVTPYLPKPTFQTPVISQRNLFPSTVPAGQNNEKLSIARLILDEMSIVRRQLREVDDRCSLITDVIRDSFQV